VRQCDGSRRVRVWVASSHEPTIPGGPGSCRDGALKKCDETVSAIRYPLSVIRYPLSAIR
jgi:hypothetical protein